MIDNSKARGLQEIYKAGCVGALNALAIECEAIAFVLVKALCRKYGLRFERERIMEMAHDAAAQFIAQYLKHSDYNVRCFSARIKRDVLNVMFGRARNKQDSFEDGQLQWIEPVGVSSWQENYRKDKPIAKNNNRRGKWEAAIPSRESQKESFNPSTALDELVSDHPQGKKIAADLYRSRSYSTAVRRIAAYVGREWVYQHAEKMHFIFKTFRWRPRESSRISGAGARGVLQDVLPGKQTKREQLDKRSGKVAKG